MIKKFKNKETFCQHYKERLIAGEECCSCPSFLSADFFLGEVDCTFNNKLKIIFLDIDGVLNSQDFYQKRFDKEKEDEIDLLAIENLNRIVDVTNANVVISSTWRRGSEICQLQELLDKFGFKGKVIGKTPCLDNKFFVRGNEVFGWLKRNVNDFITGTSQGDSTTYIILDDDSDMLLCQKDNFIHIDSKFGLTKENAEQAIKILSKGKTND